MDSPKSNRRSFLKSAGLLVAASATPQSRLISIPAAPEVAAYKYPNPGKIAIVYHPNAVIAYNNADYNVVQTMLDQGLMQLSGVTSSPADALASFFPGITASKKIAIKPNFLNSSVPTRKELAKALVTRLVQMVGGFPAANITFYERHSFSSVGYTTAYLGQPVKLVVDTSFPNNGYTIYCNGKNRPYSKSLYEADYLINMPVAKDHDCGTSFNFTLAFKNHMGTVNPGGSLGIHCDKVACLDIMASSVMTTKQRLTILDALFAVYNGGPGGSPQAMPKKIMLSQDPVTIDYQGRKLINELRLANGLGAKAGTYIEEAANTPYQIGVANPAEMNIISINLPVELAEFTAAVENGAIHLRWITTSESNNSGFVIERSIDGATEWKQVGFVKGKGSTTQQQDYAFVDAPDEQLRSLPSLFYRLKQMDYDGTTEHSFVLEVMLHPHASSWRLSQNYPNPFQSNTEIPVELSKALHVQAAIYDSSGALVSTINNQLMPPGLHHLQWDGSAFSSGIYTCRVTADGATREVRLILMK